MQLEWYGQSAFRLTDGGTTVFIDPFGEMGALKERGLRWEYPAISGVTARPNSLGSPRESTERSGARTSSTR